MKYPRSWCKTVILLTSINEMLKDFSSYSSLFTGDAEIMRRVGNRGGLQGTVDGAKKEVKFRAKNSKILEMR